MMTVMMAMMVAGQKGIRTLGGSVAVIIHVVDVVPVLVVGFHGIQHWLSHGHHLHILLEERQGYNLKEPNLHSTEETQQANSASNGTCETVKQLWHSQKRPCFMHPAIPSHQHQENPHCKEHS